MSEVSANVQNMTTTYFLVDEIGSIWRRCSSAADAEAARAEETEAVGDDRYRLRVVEVEQ